MTDGSPFSDTLDEFLKNDDEDDNETESNDDDDDEIEDEESLPPPPPISTAEIVSTNGLKIKIKKRKLDSTSDKTKPATKKKKKSKSQPSYKRRNIRTLLTKDKLQDDTLSALKAEQERLKRLEEINQPLIPPPPVINKSIDDDECILLDDDDDNDDDDNEQIKSNSNDDDLGSLLASNFEDQIPLKEPIDTNDDNSNDSDVQCVDNNYESVNNKLTQKLQRLHLDDRINTPDENGRILVNVNHPSVDPDLYIAQHLCPVLKPHQIGGIRFMYDNIVESLQRFQASVGLGCILAHSMGCGKTLQVITFIDVLLRYTTAKSVLIVVPINTIQNWLHEFNHWCPIDNPEFEYKRSFQLYILNETTKKSIQRIQMVQKWSQTGGTLIMGYEMFRLLVTKKNPTKTPNRSNVNRPSTPVVVVDLEEEEKNFETMEDVRNALLNPDLVICDEGHRIKNHQAGVAIALKSIRTHRRIVLTGYPLQNNLIEYWCMVDFVRPNYLGSKLEFCNMFERPILNGQCIDSTAEDGKLMRARAHVLHSLLEGFIQRRGADVLQCDLPPKTEYVVLLKLSQIQRQLYMKFLEAVGALSNITDKTLNPLKAFAICCKIWNHPDVLHKFVRDRQDGSEVDFDFELDQNANKTKSTPNRFNVNQRASPQMNNNFEPQTTMFTMEKKEFDYDFANSLLNSYVCGQLMNGIKFQVALTILDLCVEIGDKVLIFSQSLLSLNKLEEFLSQRTIPLTNEKWEKNSNYFRLDGATSSLERERLINAFNAPNSNARLFLLSTRYARLSIE